MSVELLEYISIFAFFTAVISLIISVVLFFNFKIPLLYQELSGKAEKREIQDINEKNARERNKSKRLSSINIPLSKKIDTTEETVPLSMISTTEVLNTQCYPQENVITVDKNPENAFVIEDDIIFIHTEEIVM